MNFVVDLIIIAIIVLSTIIGYRRGLIKSAIKICSFIIAIIVTLILYKPVANAIITNTQIDENIQTTIEKNIKGEEINTQIELTEENSENTPENVRKYLNDSITSMTNGVKENVSLIIAKNFAILIINAGCAILIFIIVRLGLVVLYFLTSIIEKIPIIKQFNKMGGFLYGILKGFLIIYVILGIVSLASPILGNVEFIQYITNSTIGGIMYNNNILLNIIF